jgi:SPX domain protein involved in polyphosphate accumulation
LAQNSTADPRLLFDATGALAGVAPGRRSGPRNLAPTPALGAVPSIRTVFERFELKYWVTEHVAQRVLEFALPYLNRDTHALTRESQRNTSLYLDTRGFRFLEDHLHLSSDRSKLRIRAYGRPYSKLAFFEIKRKVKSITMKERFALPIGEVENVLLRRPLGCELSAAARRTLGEFMLQMCLHRAEPKLYVSCFREAFESRIPGEDVRMTIDRELSYQHADGFAFRPNERRWVDLHEGDDSSTSFGYRRAILELKFNGTPPRWMVELIRHFGLKREAFSKYTTAALQLRGRL